MSQERISKESLFNEVLIKAYQFIDEDEMATDFDGASKIMDQYAEQESIRFAEWIWSEGWQPYDGHDHWINTSQGNITKWTPELFQLFKNHQSK